MDSDSQRWWCPACVRMHGLTEVELYEQDGVKGYTCRDSGAVVQPVQTPAGSESGSNGTADEQRYWCPACMRSHTASEVAPYTHGSDHGLACRLTGAVVEPLASDVQVATPSPEHPSLSPAELPQVGQRTTSNDPNIQTAAEMAQPPAPPSTSSADTRPVSLDRPADDIDRG